MSAARLAKFWWRGVRLGQYLWRRNRIIAKEPVLANTNLAFVGIAEVASDVHAHYSEFIGVSKSKSGQRLLRYNKFSAHHRTVVWIMLTILIRVVFGINLELLQSIRGTKTPSCPVRNCIVNMQVLGVGICRGRRRIVGARSTRTDEPIRRSAGTCQSFFIVPLAESIKSNLSVRLHSERNFPLFPCHERNVSPHERFKSQRSELDLRRVRYRCSRE